jgi:hypothetical protein
VRADLSLLSGSAEPKRGRGGKTYWTIVFSVEIHFGLTEFKARIKWMDNVCLFFPTLLPSADQFFFSFLNREPRNSNISFSFIPFRNF